MTDIEKALKQTTEIAEAFLGYFNVYNLPSDMENQWLALYDRLQINRELLKDK